MTNVSVSTTGATPIIIPPDELEALRAALARLGMHAGRRRL